MELWEFIYNLHYDTDKAKPVEWEADWDDAPLPYKLYRRLPVFPLPADMPLTLEGGVSGSRHEWRDIGYFLWYGYGLTQLTESGWLPDGQSDEAASTKMYRRVVPSGGALYPNEVYVYLKIEGLPQGVYHYDVAHHRLVLLREGNFDEYVASALGDRCRVSDCFGVVFVSTMFWKNFFKYYNFAYRLQGLDTGVALGQLLEVGRRFGYSPVVCFQFLDQAVNRLLGLDEREESVYAVIPLSAKPADRWFDPGRRPEREVTAPALSLELEPIRHEHYLRSKKVADYPLLRRMNEASLQQSSRWFRQWSQPHPASWSHADIRLPDADPPAYDLAALSRRRYSPDTDYVLRSINPACLASLLKGTAGTIDYRNDLDGTPVPAPRVFLYGCFYGVEGVGAGTYHYDASRHTLTQIRNGDPRFRLQLGMTMHNVNLYQVPLCMHVAGDNRHLLDTWGWRGYRIQQMEAGIMVQRLLLNAAALGMGGRPLLGFDVANTDDLYRLPLRRQTALIQVPVGPCRNRAVLEGNLHF
ncbi:SagB/ThcOx family dehydrogenase [Cohnella pontilimi]|uniref:SagB/ThcOx family dehydrogenase n=1 Tax=Cohnella pontilimi TaxID=2564100 RepID=A0A4U0FK72_9BACL|nr:SagB family peptide dehydrogenase [Cohnella pontilimi]TJY43942.1 SagB/ThcOx family dehydrogenase [Cohnella pontilimi]